MEKFPALFLEALKSLDQDTIGVYKIAPGEVADELGLVAVEVITPDEIYFGYRHNVGGYISPPDSYHCKRCEDCQLFWATYPKFSAWLKTL